MKQNLSILFLIALMAISGVAKGQTYTSTGAVTDVPGSVCLDTANYTYSVINVTGSGIITTASDVFINMNLASTCCATVKIVLIAPNGDNCMMLNMPYRSGSCSGSCLQFVSGNTLSFNSTYTSTLPAVSPIPSGNYAPTGGTYSPQVGNLSTFLTGKSINGNWILAVSSDAGVPATISSWSMVFGATALPLDLIAFSGRAQSGYNELNWVTASEKNTASFDIQRSQDEGRTFETVGNISAKGSGSNTYSFQDISYAPGINLYRLRMVDMNGEYSISQTVKIAGSPKKETGIRFTPNPVHDHFDLVVFNKALVNTEGKIINSIGQTVYAFTIEQENVKVNVNHLATGIYFIKFNDGNFYRFLKEH